MIISQVVQCDWPKCNNQTEVFSDEPLPDWYTKGVGIGWEFRCGGDLVVCPKHKAKSSEELEKQLNLS